MSEEFSYVGRVCPFTAQSCTRPSGCGVFGAQAAPTKELEERLRALNCRERGVHLFGDEVLARGLRPDRHTAADRDRYGRTVRSQLHGLRRRELQLSLDIP